tara:strand:- start:2753 stop:2989 length:237 start_codon:yes stop_codon:yes gene_type:complete
MLTPIELSQLQSGDNLTRIAVGIAGMMGLEKLMEEITSLEKIVTTSNDKAEINMATINLKFLEQTITMIGSLGEIGQA